MYLNVPEANLVMACVPSSEPPVANVMLAVLDPVAVKTQSRYGPSTSAPLATPQSSVTREKPPNPSARRPWPVNVTEVPAVTLNDGSGEVGVSLHATANNASPSAAATKRILITPPLSRKVAGPCVAGRTPRRHPGCLHANHRRQIGR